MRSLLRSPFLAAWWAGLMGLILYPIVAGPVAFEWWAVLDCVGVGAVLGGVCFLAGRTVERRAMRHKIAEVLAIGQLPPSDVRPALLGFDTAYSQENVEALRAQFLQVYGRYATRINREES